MKAICVAIVLGLFGSGCMGELEVEPEEEAVLGAGFYRPPQLMLLWVDDLEPDLPRELRPTYLHFTLANQTSASKTGVVQADVTRQDGSVFKSTAWNVQLAPAATTSGVVAFDAPYAGPNVAYALHYYDAAAPAVPAESTAANGTFPVAIRAEYNLTWVYVARAADPIIGDRDTAYLDASVDGALIDAQSLGLGYLHTNTFGDVFRKARAVDLVPGTASTATFNARIGMVPNWGGVLGGDVTMVRHGVTVSGDSIRALAPDPRGDYAEFETWFCNGVMAWSCPSGPWYRLDTYLFRVGRLWDTVDTNVYVAQIRAGQSVKLMNYGFVGLMMAGGMGNYRLDSGDGTVWNTSTGTWYAPPAVVSAPMLTKVVLRIGNLDVAIVYVQVLP